MCIHTLTSNRENWMRCIYVNIDLSHENKKNRVFFCPVRWEYSTVIHTSCTCIPILDVTLWPYKIYKNRWVWTWLFYCLKILLIYSSCIVPLTPLTVHVHSTTIAITSNNLHLHIQFTHDNWRLLQCSWRTKKKNHAKSYCYTCSNAIGFFVRSFVAQLHERHLWIVWWRGFWSHCFAAAHLVFVQCLPYCQHMQNVIVHWFHKFRFSKLRVSLFLFHFFIVTVPFD